MIDINKPVALRDGTPVTVLRTDLTGPVPGLSAEYYSGGETILVATHGGELRYYFPSGAYTRHSNGSDRRDLVNVPAATTERFIFVYAHCLNKAPGVNEVKADPCHFPRSVGDPVIRIVYEDGKPVSSEIVTSL